MEGASITPLLILFFCSTFVRKIVYLFMSSTDATTESKLVFVTHAITVQAKTIFVADAPCTALHVTHLFR